MAFSDFESICDGDENFKDTQTKQWIRNHITILESMLSILIQEPNLLCTPNPYDLVKFLIDGWEKLTAPGEAQMKLNFLQIETAEKDSQVSKKHLINVAVTVLVLKQKTTNPKTAQL